jgi:hypothetical protein
MEVSCRLPRHANWCGASADWFNISCQEKWGSGFKFLRGDHKAVKGVENPRPELVAGGVKRKLMDEFQ